MKPTSKFGDLIEIMKTLRRECPWDRKQTHESIKDNLIEEAYEVIEAIDQKDTENLKKELGDLLLHVVFHSRIADEVDEFNIGDVIYALQEKMIRRHPHVFGDTKVDDESEVARNWEAIKMTEGRNSVLDGLPARLPALIRARRMQEKAGSVGFDWKKSPRGKQQLWGKLQEELDEFKEVYEKESANLNRLKEEYGDLLFSIVNAGRFLDLEAENALRATNAKFERRFQYIEQQVSESGRTLREVSLEEMEGYWQEAKTQS